MLTYSRLFWVLLIGGIIPISGWAKNLEPREIARTLQTADQALMRHEFQRARDLYRLVWTESPEASAEAPGHREIPLDLARCEKEIGNFEEARSLLSSYLRGEIPESKRIEAQLLLARICSNLGQHDEAYALLNLTETLISRDCWGRDDIALHSYLSLLLDESIEQQLKKGQRAFDSGHYAVAVEAYSEALHAVEKGTYPAAKRANCSSELCQILRYRIGECHYRSGDYTQTLSWMSRCGDAGDRASLLMGLAHLKAGQGEAAIPRLSEFLSRGERSPPDIAQAEWSLARACLAVGRLKEARLYFDRRSRDGLHPRLTWLSHLQLARLDLKEGDREGAELRLNQLSRLVTDEPVIRREMDCLLGEIALQKGELMNAVRQLELALPVEEMSSAQWFLDALHTLAISYLQLSELQDTPTAEVLLTKADSVFRRLQTLSDNSRYRLGLARVCLERLQRFKSLHLRDELIALTAIDQYRSHDEQLEALRLRERLGSCNLDQPEPSGELSG